MFMNIACTYQDHSSYAPSNLFVLLSWSCGLYTTCTKHNAEFPSANAFRALVGSMAFLLDLVSESTIAKPSLKHGSVVRVRRALRASPTNIPSVISTLLALAKTSQSPLRFTSLLGVSVDVLIRLKTTDEPPESRLPVDLKNLILTFYTTSILMSKTTLSPHISTALDDFVATFVTGDDFTKAVLPTVERALLRSPEICLPAVTKFFSTYNQPLDETSFKKVVTQAINSSKSANASVRSNAIDFFKTVLKRNEPLAETALGELLALPKTGKTAGPDHRIALYAMLQSLPPHTSISPTLLQSVAPLLAKETNETATSTLASALPPHIVYLLNQGSIAPEIPQLVTKELASAKPAVRRAFSILLGTVFYQHQELLETDAGVAFAKAVLPALENSLKNVAANPLNAPGGPIEGYVAIAIMLGPLSRSGKFSESIHAPRNITQTLIQSRRRDLEEHCHRIASDEHDKAIFPPVG